MIKIRSTAYNKKLQLTKCLKYLSQTKEHFTIKITCQFIPFINKISIPYRFSLLFITPKMGSQASIQFPKHAWSQFKKTGNCRVYHNGKGLYAQKSQIMQDKKIQPTEELKTYKERCQTQLPIVKVYNIILQEEKKNFCSTMQKIIVYVEHTPNRLSNIKSFSLSQFQCLYVLRQAIKGFWELFRKFGYFQIKHNMIGFNSQGEVKCWNNPNFASNRIQYADQSILSFGSGDSSKNIQKLDSRLRDSIEKGMVSQLWQIVKKKSNIQNKQLYYKLSNLQTSNFQNSSRLIQYLAQKSPQKIPECLYFENCVQNLKSKHRQFSYGDIIEQNHSKTRLVQLFQQDLFSSGILNASIANAEPNIKDFDAYRQHIQKIRPKYSQNNDLSISFDKPCMKNENPEHADKKKLGKNVLCLVDRTIDISLSSISQNPSYKTINIQSEASDKKIEFLQNLQLPVKGIKHTYSCFVPNAISERYILEQVPQNTSSRIAYDQNYLGSPRQRVQKQAFDQKRMMSPSNYPTLSRKPSNTRFIPPTPIPGLMRRQQSIVGVKSGHPNEPSTPQFNKIGYH